jgi:hypothetical protein
MLIGRLADHSAERLMIMHQLNAQPVTMVLEGASRQKYTFQVYPWGTSFKSVGGVYVVTHAEPNLQGGNNHKIIYVGQTGDLSERFEFHHKASCFRLHKASHICVYLEQAERSRLTIESGLIASYNPACNG